VKNRISAFCRPGNDGYALVVVDECHGLTPTVQGIIAEMRKGNPNLRVLGLTATPYRLGSGWIFREGPDGQINGEDTARDPYFAKCVYKVGARDLIAQGFLTNPVIGQINAEGYDTAGLALNSRGQFDAAQVDRAYHGHGRKTSAIVADVVAQSQNRAGVMFFAATVQHAREVLASLPPQLSAIVTAETPKAERDSLIRRFKDRLLKYIVNVSVLTTGFDAPHVDVIAILRKTESVGLLQQIIGRGLRVDPNGGKADCLILDYTTNLDDHCPDGDLFAPVVRAGKGPGEGGSIPACCPTCDYENAFTANPQYLDCKYDAAGYALDLDGNQIMSEWGPIPVHLGRRCMGLVPVSTGARGQYDRCDYRWTFKPCPHCEAPNDIAARYCSECRGEIVNPNDKLRAEFKAFKKDPTQWQTDEVISMTCKEGVSAKGNKTVRVEWVTPWRQFSTWFSPDSKGQIIRDRHEVWQRATKDGTEKPLTVTYRKDPFTQFFEIRAYNREADHAPS
jgi:DNA repair protein RadD